MKKFYLLSALLLAPFFSSAITSDTLAYYPLVSDGVDRMGINDNMTLVNAPFSNGGVYCDGNPSNYTVLSPEITNFLFSSFYIGFDFMVEEYLAQPVIVGGQGYRWLGFYLKNDSTISLLYNNSNYLESTVTYETNQWYTGSITYNGSTARIYLNGVLVTAWTGALDYIVSDTKIGTRNYANPQTFKGYIRNLVITNDFSSGLPEQATSTLSFLPSPAHDYLTISGHALNSEVNIYDLTGRLLISTHNQNKPIDISGMNRGVYFVRINDNGKFVTGKFIKN